MKYTFVEHIKRTSEFLNWREQSIACGLTVLAFTVLGPFETSALPLFLRLVYWMTCILVGWGSVLLMLTLLLRHPKLDEWPLALRIGLAVSVASIPIGLTVTQVERVIRGNQLGVTALVNVFFVCALIGGLMYMRVSTRIGVTQKTNVPAMAPFLKRLPYDVGDQILSLSTQDHYVEVTTTKGTALILVRFQDAIEELGQTGGVQIHRSHWVAQGAMRKLKRHEGKLMVELIDGRVLPVSRTYAQTVRAVLS